MDISNEHVFDIEEFRQSLLHLHETLLSFEKKQYEALYGRIVTTSQYLSIVTDHPSFNWLKSLSTLIVALDETFQNSEAPKERIIEICTYLNQLLTPSEIGSPFSQKYFDAIQKDPNVLIAHAKVKELLSSI